MRVRLPLRPHVNTCGRWYQFFGYLDRRFSLDSSKIGLHPFLLVLRMVRHNTVYFDRSFPTGLRRIGFGQLLHWILMIEHTIDYFLTVRLRPMSVVSCNFASIYVVQFTVFVYFTFVICYFDAVSTSISCNIF